MYVWKTGRSEGERAAAGTSKSRTHEKYVLLVCVLPKRLNYGSRVLHRESVFRLFTVGCR